MNKTFTPSARRHHLLYWLSCLAFSAIPTISEAFVFENLEYTITDPIKQEVAVHAVNFVGSGLLGNLDIPGEFEFEGETYYPEMVMGPPRKGLKVAYCTDSRPTRSIVEGARGADLFICEGMYGERGSEERAAEHKHMNFAEAAALAKAAEVRELWLTHFSPALNHPEEFIDVAREIFPNAKTGTDGMSLTLKFTEE